VRDWPQPHRLLENSLQIGLISVLELGPQAGERVGCWSRKSKAQASVVAGALGVREQQRHQLLADLLVAHRFGVLVGGLDQRGEDVIALGKPWVRSAYLS
jgi:hypothetical protein